MRNIFLAIMLLIGLTLTAQTEYKLNDKQNGFSIGSRSNTTTTIVHNVNAITLEDADREGLEGQFLTWSGIHIANQAGAPNLPSGSTFVAIPNGATPSLKMLSAKTKTIANVDLIPAPQPQLDNDNTPAVYQRDMGIYGRNAFYPETPFQISETMTVRGVQMVQIGVMPFQYNPVTKELIVYEDLELELTTKGGDGTIGDLRYRTPEWDQILEDMLLNRDVLPKVDYNEKLRKHYENRETGCEYIIITPDNEEFVQLADSIKLFRIAQGIPTEIYTVSQCGGNNDNSIRSFIQNAYNNWDMPPAAVLILGDHNTDPTKGVVSFTMNNHPGGTGYNPYISDHRYSVMGNNHMPQIIIGRITGRDHDELYRMIKKDLDYERTPPTNPGFYDNPITAMGFQLERWFQLCSEIVNGFWEYELGKHPVRINAVYQGTPGSRWSTNENTNTVVNYFGPSGCGYIPNSMSHLNDWSGTGNKVNDAINNGAFILQHRDHGAEELWGEPSYSIGYINRLSNPDLTYVMSCNCLTGRFNYSGENGCFAEAFHRHQQGALGLIAATQVSYSFVNDVYVWGAYDNMWPEFMPTYGTEHASNFILPAFGNAAGKYFLRQSSWTDDYVKEITYYLFHQHGDAYMNLYSEVPQHLNVEMLPVIAESSAQYQIKADKGATICLTANGQIIGFAEATGDTQLIDITPQPVGTRIKLTIKKQNYYRYEHEIATIPSTTPYLILNSVVFNDEEGNGNALPDYNETCKLNVSLHNVGFASIDQVKATLTCQHPDIEIINDEADFGTIHIGETPTVNDAFTINIGETLNDGEKVRFYLQIEGNGFHFTDSIDATINAPLLSCSEVTISNLQGEPTGHLFRGESSLLTFIVKNMGHSKSLDLTNVLSFKAPFLDIVENPLAHEAIEANASAEITFQVNLHEDAPKGNILSYQYEIQSGVRTVIFDHNAALGYTTEDFEDEQLNSHLQWGLGSGNKRWQIVEDETATEGYCLRSPSINNNNNATLSIGIHCAIPETFTFSHKTSTEQNDVLQLTINSAEMATWSGVSDQWEQSTFMLKEGSNIIKFSFKKDGQGSAGEDCVMIDHLLFPPMAELFVYAGDDTEACLDQPFTPNSCILYPKTIAWSTDGDGVFDDPSKECPNYTFGPNDIQNGQVTLSITASDDNNNVMSDSVDINLLEGLSAFKPNLPQGDTAVDMRLVSNSRYQGQCDGNVDFIWSMEPAEAGQLNAEGSTVEVVWNEGFTGIANLSYSVSNGCSESEAATIMIRVFNSTSINENNTSIEVYPNPASEQIHVKAQGIGNNAVMLRIIDVLGRVILEDKVTPSNGSFDLPINTATLRKGLYCLQVTCKDGTWNAHLLIK